MNFLKSSNNSINLNVSNIRIGEGSKYESVASLPSNPENGLIVYHNNDLKIYNNNQWETIANTSNETFNNLTVNNNLTLFGLPLPKISTIAYTIENIGGTYFLTAYPNSSQYGNIAIDFTLTTNVRFRRGEIYLDTTNCGINNILFFNAYNVYTDKQNCNLTVRSDTQLFNSFLPPNPAPTTIKLFTYIDQTRVTTDLTTETLGGLIFTFNVLIISN